jgi:Holliday junction resolvasome RuvABC endonuclease subunit
MKVIITVDPGLLAWAWGIYTEDGKYLKSATVTYKGKQSQEHRLNEIYNELCDVVESLDDKYEIEQIVVEKQFVEIMSQIVGVIRAFAGWAETRTTLFVPASWRKLAIGKGNATEDQVKEKVLSVFPELAEASEHEIDTGALYLAYRKSKENETTPKKTPKGKKLR